MTTNPADLLSMFSYFLLEYLFIEDLDVSVWLVNRVFDVFLYAVYSVESLPSPRY